ncbi:MAG: NUDIX hydrolase [uncultured bacterium]|nr:MAG: NUDIX hydrolase [uncultured bacterium]
METEKPKSSQPIPDHAEKVFEGKMFDVYQWKQEMYDGSTKIFEKAQRPDTTDVIAFTEEGKIIVLDQEQPGKERFFSLPGGRIEEGEDPMDSARRELTEETGYECGEIELWHSSQPVGKLEWAMYFFVARNCKKIAQQNLDGGEKIKVMLVSVDEFLDMIFSQKMKASEIILKILKENLLVLDKEETYNKVRNHFK